MNSTKISKVSAANTNKGKSTPDSNLSSLMASKTGSLGSTTTNSKRYRITNIHFCTNERDEDFQSNLIYAELHDGNGKLVISATLDEICEKIIQRGYEGINFERDDNHRGRGVRIKSDGI